ncbi:MULTISPECIES: DUF6233 domain-containing protein [unclassified Streptomyces]
MALDRAEPIPPRRAERRRAIGRDRARALLADGIRACAHCRPDNSLGVLG